MSFFISNEKKKYKENSFFQLIDSISGIKTTRLLFQDGVDLTLVTVHTFDHTDDVRLMVSRIGVVNFFFFENVTKLTFKSVPSSALTR